MKYDFGVPLYQVDLDEEINDGNEGEPRRRIDTFVIEGEKTGQEVWGNKYDARVVLGVIKEICTKQEYEILRAYFVDGTVMEEIGKSHKVCRERIRQKIQRVRKELVARKIMKQMPDGNKGLRGMAG
jgi:DNA-directed RNA polymerase sigma subunit (sigma70/sigma32)